MGEDPFEDVVAGCLLFLALIVLIGIAVLYVVSS